MGLPSRFRHPVAGRNAARPKRLRPSTRRAPPAFEILEDRRVPAGGFPGVPDVEGQFVALKHHGEAVGYFLAEEQGAPNPTIFDHHQGIARYPGTGTPVLYVTQLDDDDSDPQGGTTGGYLEVIRLGSRGTDGERLRSNLQSPVFSTEVARPPAEDTWLGSTRFNGIGVTIDDQTLRPYKHLGGMAIVDNVLFVAMDQPDGPGFGDEGMIVLFDLGRDGEWRETPRPLRALSLDHAIDNLAVTETAGGQYLVWVNGDGGAVTRFYKTAVAVAEPGVTHLRNDTLHLEPVPDPWDPGSPDDFDPGGSDGWATGSGAHQSSTFIREADGPAAPDAPLYLIGMRHSGVPQPFFGSDFADLYRVTDNGLGGYKLTHVRTLHLFCEYDGAERIGNFAAGNNAYVSPSGELILYSVQHEDEDVTGPDYVKMEEFRHRDVTRRDSPLRLPAADAGGPYAVPEGGTVLLHGGGAPSADRPWVELFDDTDGWLHRFEHPDDHEGDRSIVVDYDDRDLFELNDFNFLDNFGDKTSSVRWRLPPGLNVELFDDHDFEDTRLILRGTGRTEAIRDLDRFGFGDKTSSMRFVGSEPDPSALTFTWDLDADGAFGETGAGAGLGDETTASPTFSAAGLDGPGVFPVSLRVSDGAGRSAVATAAVSITNVAPTVTTLTSGSPDLAHKSADGVVTVSGSFADPAGPLDTHAVRIDWGDGTGVETLPAAAVDQAGDTFAHAHPYATGGVFTVTVTVADEDGAVSDARTATAVVTGVGLVERVLYVIGTDDGDDVLVGDKDLGARVEVRAKLGRDRLIDGSFPSGAVDRLVVLLGGGADQAQIQDKVTIDALILGGDGRDQLYGGGGHNALVGGGGDDDLFGGDRADLLIGGGGQDRLHGKKGNDVLVGGLTDRDEDLAALAAALTAWKAEDLAGVLNALTAVHDDGDEDDLEGGLGADRLFGGTGDKLKES